MTRPDLGTTLALVERARSGDRAALELVAERYRVALTRFAHGRLPANARGLSDTADLVQVAIVRMLDRLDGFEPEFKGALLAYLRLAVLNQVRDEIRRARRRPATESLPLELPCPWPDPLQQVIRDEERERYDAALAALPAEQQRAFLMRLEMDCSYREIAEALGRPTEEAARSLVRRAIAAMAGELRRTGAR